MKAAGEIEARIRLWVSAKEAEKGFYGASIRSVIALQPINKFALMLGLRGIGKDILPESI
jgi:hypothetical protein